MAHPKPHPSSLKAWKITGPSWAVIRLVPDSEMPEDLIRAVALECNADPAQLTLSRATWADQYASKGYVPAEALTKHGWSPSHG